MHVLRNCVVLLILCSCHPDKFTKVNAEELAFRTRDDTEIYFKNVRQSAYHLEEREDQGINEYNLKAASGDTLSPVPTLLINWRHDTAFLLFENLSDEASFWIDSATFKFEKGHPRQNTVLSIDLYNSLLDARRMSITLSNRQVPLSSEQAEQFRTVVFDYLRLVGLR